MYWQVSDLSIYALSDFINIMRWLIRQAVFPVVEHVPKLLMGRADYWNFCRFVVIMSRLLAEVSCGITSRSKVSCSTVTYVSLMCRFFFILGLHFRSSVVSPSGRHRRGWVVSYFYNFHLLLRCLEWGFDPFATAHFIILEPELMGSGSLSSLSVQNVSIGSCDA